MILYAYNLGSWGLEDWKFRLLFYYTVNLRPRDSITSCQNQTRQNKGILENTETSGAGGKACLSLWSIVRDFSGVTEALLQGSLEACLSLPSVTVIQHGPKATWGGKSLFQLPGYIQSREAARGNEGGSGGTLLASFPPCS